MKSFITALCIAVALIIASSFSTKHLEQIASSLENTNNKVADAIRKDDFDTAVKEIAELSDYLAQCEPFFAATGNHEEIDNIEMNLAELRIYAMGGFRYDALSKSEVLSFLFNHLPKNSRLKLENIL